jgi:DNA-binding transcriptional MerR regulator
MSSTTEERSVPAAGAGYPIGEVVTRTGLTTHTLRWYERIGLMPRVDRSHAGQRRYTEGDLSWLAFIGKLRMTGMTVADMVRYAELRRAGDATYPERLDLLVKHREAVLQRIADLHGTLDVLDFKIELYGGALAAPERH